MVRNPRGVLAWVTARNVRRMRRAAPAEPAQFDPVALGLALWLGMIACAGGIMRLQELERARAATGLYGTPPAVAVVEEAGGGEAGQFVYAL